MLHLRFPFSFFLLPIYLFALSQTTHPNSAKAVWVFVILHFLIYPASNAFNSYFDRDEGPIGGLEKPPPVQRNLYWTALCFDGVAVLLAWLMVTEVFAITCLAYILVSRAYSHPWIRLKRYAILSWLVVAFFQGGFTYGAVWQAIGGEAPTTLFQQPMVLLAMGLATSNLLGFYPMTQIYQHEEDAQRGDQTISRMVGIRGTFVLTAVIFLCTTVGFGIYFWEQYLGNVPVMAVYLLVMGPVLSYFLVWGWRVWHDERQANFRYTMGLNLLGSLCLNLFFGLLCIKNSLF